MKLKPGKDTIKYLLVAMVALITLDGLLTEFLVGKGAAREVNPILQPMIGDIGFMIFKIVGALVCALILWDINRRYPRLAVVSAWIGVGAYAAITIWNTSLILLS